MKSPAFSLVRSLGALLCIFLLLLNPVATYSQPQPELGGAPQQAPIVRSIEVQYAGPPTVSRERVLANMRTAVGKPYSQQEVEEDIRSLYATGNITNVRMFGEPVRDGVKVVVVIQSKSTVGEVAVEGATQVNAGKLRKQLTTKPGQTLNEQTLEQDRQKILDTYADRGFPDTQVTYRTDVNDQTGAARVVFTVKEAGKAVIRHVRFEGNQAFNSNTLRKQMKTKSANLLSVFTKAGRLNRDQLETDRAALRDFYQNHGYEDAQIGDPRIDDLGKGRVELVIPIQEGPQYHFGAVAINGAQVFTPDEVRAKIKAHEGAVFSPKVLRDDTKAIGDLYGSRGYIDMQATADTANVGPQTIGVDYRISEGTQSYIEHINIQGNTRTKEKIIRRELAIAPGDVYDTTRVDVSKQRLQNLNYFSQVQTFPSDTLVPGRKDLNVLLEEKRTGSFNFGAGFSSIDSLLGFAEVQQTNFDLLGWRNGFTGGGERFRARVQYGTERKDFLVSLTEPYFLDYQLAVGGELFYNEASFVSTAYNQRDYGFDINMRKPINNFTSLRLDYRLEDIELYDLSSDASDIIRRDEGTHTKSSLTGGVTYDTRDSVFLTRHGHRLDLSAYVAGGVLGGNENIYGFDVAGSQYFLLPWDTIFLINGEVATVNNFDGSDHVPVYDRLYLGGPNTLRGFGFRNASPRDENNVPIGGNTLARLTFEYTMPVVDRVRAAVFYDTGFINGGAYEFSTNSLASDVGFGVRLDLPIGPIRLDYGIPVQGPSDYGKSGKFNFTIGYQF